MGIVNGYKPADYEISDNSGTFSSDVRVSKNILIVDDSEDMRELLSVVLHREGIIQTAVNGLDALSKFAGHHFDLVISDIEMPVMNGIDLFMNLPDAYRQFFMFFSGSDDWEYLNIIQKNAIKFFRKPDDIFRLYREVQQKLSIPAGRVKALEIQQ